MSARYTQARTRREDDDEYSYARPPSSQQSSQPPAYQSHSVPRTSDLDDYDQTEYVYDYHMGDQGAAQGGSQYLAAPGIDRKDSRTAASAMRTGRAPPGANLGRAPSAVSSVSSMYSDPYEPQSTLIGCNTPRMPLGQLPLPTVAQSDDEDFLDHDPYGADTNNQKRQSQLERADTLRPGDSISEYQAPINHNVANVRPMSEYGHAYTTSMDGQAGPAPYMPASGRQAAYAYDPYAHGNEGEEVGFQTYQARSSFDPDNKRASGYSHAAYDPYYQPGNNSMDVGRQYDYPLGYADDEYDQDRQLKDSSYYHSSSAPVHPAVGAPGLFSNQMADTGRDGLADSKAYNGDRGSFDPDDEAGPSKRGLLGFRKDSLERQIEKRRRGIGRQRWPVVTWVFALAYVVVFILELIRAKQQTGQAIQTKPYFAPMVGPNSEFLIAFGARYVPCMRKTPAVPLDTSLICLSATTSSSTTYDQSQICPLWQICGLPDAQTHGQQWRLVTAMFLHAGFVHIIFNLVVQLTLVAQIERLLGSVFFTIVYILGGLGGNLLGGNFGLVASPSVGASGAIYSCIAIELVDLFYNWRYEYRVKTRVALSVVFTIVGLAVGLLPGLDNFAHIGGLAVGLLGGMIVCPSIHATSRHRFVIWVLRLLAAVALAGYFAALTLNFYRSEDPTKACEWCRYLSCLPQFKQCQNNGLATSQVTTTSSGSNTSRRDWTLL
ncbi:unnamed protein product [Jaminaea pallidilutea]